MPGLITCGPSRRRDGDRGLGYGDCSGGMAWTPVPITLRCAAIYGDRRRRLGRRADGGRARWPARRRGDQDMHPASRMRDIEEREAPRVGGAKVLASTLRNRPLQPRWPRQRRGIRAMINGRLRSLRMVRTELLSRRAFQGMSKDGVDEHVRATARASGRSGSAQSEHLPPELKQLNDFLDGRVSGYPSGHRPGSRGRGVGMQPAARHPRAPDGGSGSRPCEVVAVDSMTGDRTPPPVVLEEARADTFTLAPNGQTSVPPGHNTLDLRITALSF